MVLTMARGQTNLNKPIGIVYHASHQSLYVCDFGNDCLKKITMDGIPSSFYLAFDSFLFTIIRESDDPSQSAQASIHGVHNRRHCIGHLCHQSSIQSST